MQVERKIEGASAMGTVVVKGKDEPRAGKTQHARLAGARAWLALGEKLLEGGDAEAAISCAHKGLEELGDSYSDPLILDDTELKLAAAEDRIDSGHKEDGAVTMLAVLAGRLSMYKNLHKDEVVE